MTINQKRNDLSEIDSLSVDRMNQWISLDIIIPVYNEEKTLDLLFQRLETVFSSSNREKYQLNTVRYIMIDDGTLRLLLEISIGGAFSLWGLYAIISKDFRNLIIYWRRKFGKGGIIVTSREEYDRINELNNQAARRGQSFRPVVYIHLDSNLKFNMSILNIWTFLIIILGIISLLSFRNHIFSSITSVIYGLEHLYGIALFRLGYL